MVARGATRLQRRPRVRPPRSYPPRPQLWSEAKAIDVAVGAADPGAGCHLRPAPAHAAVAPAWPAAPTRLPLTRTVRAADGSGLSTCGHPWLPRAPGRRPRGAAQAPRILRLTPRVPRGGTLRMAACAPPRALSSRRRTDFHAHPACRRPPGRGAHHRPLLGPAAALAHGGEDHGHEQTCCGRHDGSAARRRPLGPIRAGRDPERTLARHLPRPLRHQRARPWRQDRDDNRRRGDNQAEPTPDGTYKVASAKFAGSGPLELVFDIKAKRATISWSARSTCRTKAAALWRARPRADRLLGGSPA